MEKKTFSIPKISCHHCVMTIKRELSDLEGVLSVDGDPARKEIAVEWKEPATEVRIKALLNEINYPAS